MIADPPALLRQLFDAAVHRAMPLNNLGAYLPTPPGLGKGRTLVLGAGKAAGAMAQALEALWPPDAPLSGLVVTRYGHTPPRSANLPQRIDVVEAAHPVPDAAGMAASQRMLDLARGLGSHDLVICLISGGGSALLTLPAAGLSLETKQRISRELLACGASIAEINCVRKHLSRIKGGRLALACHPARVVTLAISDVPGDDIATIASGPTVPDPTTCAEALLILKRYMPTGIGLDADLIKKHLSETPKPDMPELADHTNQLIATPRQSLAAAAALARLLGLNAYILSDQIEGESREVGKVHGALARAAALATEGCPFVKPCVILSGGETTVTIKQLADGVAAGRGGRAGEFGLGLAQALQGQAGVWALAADTDGIDGVEDNAGVIVCPDTLARARVAGLSLTLHADHNDSYGFFNALGNLLVTGPTHTNVNDFRALLVL